MTRLATLLLFGVAAIALPGAAFAADAGADTPNPDLSLKPLEALDGLSSADPLALSLSVGSVELGLGFSNPESLTDSELDASRPEDIGFGRDLLFGLGDARQGFDRGSFAGTLVELADTFSIATLFRTSEGPAAALAPSHDLIPAEQPFGQAWFVGFEARYRPSERLSIGFSYGVLREDDRMLGTATSTDLAEVDQALTQSLGLGLSYVFNDRLSASVFYDHVRVETEGAGLGAGDNWSGDKLGASVEVSRIFTETDQLSFAALQPFNVFSAASRAHAPFSELDGEGDGDSFSLLFLDPDAVPLALSFSYLDEGADIPRGLTFSLEDDDVRDTDGLNVSAVATVKVPF